MEQFTAVLSIISPIFVAVLLGVLAKKKNIMTAQQMSGLQQFVVKFGLPCVLFNSCFTADFGAESVTSMMLVVPLQLMSCIWAFWARKKVFCYRNLPMMFSSQESGMLGIPLFIALFGAEQAYRIGVLDLAQAHEKALFAPESGHYNLGTGSGYSVKQILDAARKVTGHPIPADVVPRRPGDPPTLIACSDKAREVLGWKPQFEDPEIIIESAWKWCQKHPEGYGD
jgi:hypothetical protein